MKIYSSGGFRYVIGTDLRILEVFPLEDGLLIKCLRDSDTLPFRAVNAEEQQREFAYITLTRHPLNDLKPLFLLNDEQKTEDLIAHKIDVFFVSSKGMFLSTEPLILIVPFVLYRDLKSHELCFALLRRNAEDDDDGTNYIFSLDNETNRHDRLRFVAKNPELLLHTVHREPLDSMDARPSACLLTDTLSGQDFCVALYYKDAHLLRFYECTVGRAVKCVTRVQRMIQLDDVLSVIAVRLLHCGEFSALP